MSLHCIWLYILYIERHSNIITVWIALKAWYLKKQKNKNKTDSSLHHNILFPNLELIQKIVIKPACCGGTVGDALLLYQKNGVCFFLTNITHIFLFNKNKEV